MHSLHSKAAQENARIWTRGQGAVIYDQDGKEHLDALAGLWNVILGHGRKELADAAAAQMNQLAYATCYTGSSNPLAIELGETLSTLCYPGINRFFFTSGGGESNESAFKTARYYWKIAGRAEKTKFISGLTMSTLKKRFDVFWKVKDWDVCSAICVEMQYRRSGLHKIPEEDELDV